MTQAYGPSHSDARGRLGLAAMLLAACIALLVAAASIFPVTIEKMYDGPDTGSSDGTKTQGNQ